MTVHVCCTVEEIMKQLEGHLRQNIDEHLAEQRELEALDERQYMYAFSCSVQCVLIARKVQACLSFVILMSKLIRARPETT